MPKPKLDRSEACDTAVPDLLKQVEALVGHQCIAIGIIIDPEGFSITGNVTHEGLIQYLEDALAYVKANSPDRVFSTEDEKSH